MTRTGNNIKIKANINHTEYGYDLIIFVFDKDGNTIHHSVCRYDTLEEVKRARVNAFACWLN